MADGTIEDDQLSASSFWFWEPHYARPGDFGWLPYFLDDFRDYDYFQVNETIFTS